MKRAARPSPKRPPSSRARGKKPADLRKQRAAALKAQGKKRKQIAKEVGVSETTVKRYNADPEFQKMVDERRERMRQAADVEGQEVIGTLAAQMRGDVTDAFEWNSSPLIDRLKAYRLGHLIKSITTRRELDRSQVPWAEVEIERIEFHSSQSAAIQLCKVLGLEKVKGDNPSDPATLKALLEERIAFAIEGFAKGGVKLERRDILEMYAKAPASSGELMPLIKDELAALTVQESDKVQ